MTDVLEVQAAKKMDQMSGPNAALGDANNSQKKWLELWREDCCIVERLEEECIQERARLKELESEFRKPSLETSDDKQRCSEDLWSELVEVRSEVRRLRQREPEVSRFTVEKSESERIRAKLQEINERQQQSLIRVTTTIQDLEKSLEAVQHHFRDLDGDEDADDRIVVVSSPRGMMLRAPRKQASHIEKKKLLRAGGAEEKDRKDDQKDRKKDELVDLEKSLEAVQHHFRDRDGDEDANDRIVANSPVGTMKAYSVGSPVGLVRAQSAGSLRGRRWCGPCGGDGGAFLSGRMVYNQSSPTLSLRRSSSRTGVKELMKNDGVLKIIRTSLQILEEKMKEKQDEGNWPSAEYEAFMRIFRMFRRQSRSVICERLLERFPSVPSDEIETHLDWCIDYEEKQSSKRELLSKFRDRIVHLGLEASEAEEASLEEKERRGNSLTRSRSLQQRKQVEEWRRSREEAATKAAALEKKLGREKAKREKSEKKLEAEQREETRKLVESFREKRSAEERARECNQHSTVDADTRNRIERRNAEVLKKLSEANAEARQLTARDLATDKKNPKYENVPSRLYDSTASWRLKACSHYEVID